MADDWRLMGQEKQLTGRTLKWTTWSPFRLGWDHDHCAFCQAEISDQPIGEHVSFNAAWVTADDNYTWVCPDCFAAFAVQLQWRTEDTPNGAH